jgi:hypothetical protein
MIYVTFAKNNFQKIKKRHKYTLFFDKNVYFWTIKN